MAAHNNAARVTRCPISSLNRYFNSLAARFQRQSVMYARDVTTIRQPHQLAVAIVNPSL